MNSIMETIITTLIANTLIQSAIVVMVIALIGLLTRRYFWVHHVVAIAIEAYEYAEKEGFLKNLKAYAKFEPFMKKFIEQYRADYGKEPTPKAKALAVEAMEKAVNGEHLGK